jgi:aspartate aminotransferase
MQAQGVDVINMSLGEPDQDTPLFIRNAAQQAVADNWSHYGPVPGIASLRQAVAARQNSTHSNAVEWQPGDVIVSVGAKAAIYNAIQTLVNEGDEVLIPTPSWVSYGEMVKLAGGKVIAIPTTAEENYCLTAAQLQQAITPRTRMLILCSPNNPTGTVYSDARMDALAGVLRAWPEITILSDEIYNGLTYGTRARTWAYYTDLAERLIIVNGVSKTYAMTGYRIGWSLCKNPAFVAACTRLQSQQFTCATVIAQKAAEAALTADPDSVAYLRTEFEQRRDLICRLAREVKGWRFVEPQGAFYLFPDVSAIGNGDTVAEYLLEKAHVAVVSGSAFGDPSCIRLSFAISNAAIEQAMQRIKKALEK